MALLPSRFRQYSGAFAGLLLVSIVAVPALVAPWLPIADPTLTAPAQRMLPTGAAGHPLGTDALGRDLLARLVWGARSSLAVGLIATVAAALAGTVIGILAGFFGRLTDALLMRGIDVLMAFPYLLLALAIVAALGPGLNNAMLAIAVANVPFFARAVRGAVLEIRHRDYIDAARLAGHRAPWIIGVELLPNLVPTVLLLMTTTLGWMVLETAGLSFLGLGAQPPHADLGAMLGEGREFLTTYPRVAIWPGLLILILVVGINLLGDALRDLLDPRLRDRALEGVLDAAGAGPIRSADANSSGRSARHDHAQPVGQANELLSVDALSVWVPGQGRLLAAVDGLDLHLRAGERVGVVGESGSGKSLTAMALLGFAPPGGRLTGVVRLDGIELLGLAGEALRDLRGRRVAYIPQEPLDALDPLLSIGYQLREAVEAHANNADVCAAERVRALLEMVGLDKVAAIQRRLPHELSGGQRQRVVIAMALAHEPALLIADEATTALDVTVQAEIIALLEALTREQDRALLFVSHDLALVAALCDRVAVLYAGRVVEDGPLEKVLAAPAHPYTAALLACSPELGNPGKPLAAVAGHPPSPEEASAASAAGCRFEPRCPKAQPDCRDEEPQLTELEGRHRVRCLFPEVATGADRSRRT
jgi:peptide/nickel transport system permease protein